MSISNFDSSQSSNSKSQLYPLPKLTISLTRTLSNEFSLTNTTLSTSINSAHPPERETWLGSLTSGIGLSSKSRNTSNESPIVIADLSDRPKAGILLNSTSVPSTPQITPSQSTDPPSQPSTPNLLPQPSLNLTSSSPLEHSTSAPILNGSFQLPPSSTNTNHSTRNNDQSNQTRQVHSRSLTIKFAPLPDPRSMKQRSYSTGGDLQFNRELLPDGTISDYALALRPRDLDPLSINENVQSDHLSAHSAQPPLLPGSSLENQTLSSASDSNPLTSQSKNPSNLANSPARTSLTQLPNNHALYRTPTGSTSVSSLGTSSCLHPPSSVPNESISRKLINAVSKQRKPRSLNTSSSNLSYTSSLESASFGAPLRQTRSVESSYSISAKSSASDSMPTCLRKPILRRTKSKEEELEQRPRRRAQYPPVAQRKVHMGGSRGGAGRVSIIEEPAFDEWGVASGSAKGRPTTTSTSASSVSDFGSIRSAIVADDDGSGMAWLRKRRQEREEKARREAEARSRIEDGTSTPTTSTSHNITHHQLASVPSDLTEEQEILKPIAVTPQAANLPPINTSTADFSASSASDQTSKSSAGTAAGTNTASSNEGFGTKEDEEEEEEIEQVADEEEEDEDDEEEIRKEDLLQAKVLAESPFVKGVKEVYKEYALEISY
ncbi:hypothetical protein DFH28DRAFT_322875 [Melampsora americana]|nr:hypothetical protein DFH28DRAFT_322875 [Melampsora americana]